MQAMLTTVLLKNYEFPIEFCGHAACVEMPCLKKVQMNFNPEALDPSSLRLLGQGPVIS